MGKVLRTCEKLQKIRESKEKVSDAMKKDISRRFSEIGGRISHSHCPTITTVCEPGKKI